MKALSVAFAIAAAGTYLGQTSNPLPDPILKREADLAALVVSHVHIKGFILEAKVPQVRIETHSTLSSYRNSDRTIREARWEELTPAAQRTFDRWAGYTVAEPSGQHLFEDVFYKYFLVREVGCWLQFSVIKSRHDHEARKAAKNLNADHWESELEADRLSVAWWRQEDPAYLAQLVKDLRAIQSRLNSPVPHGQDLRTYFTGAYDELSKKPEAYAWFQLEMVLTADNESPSMTFQQAIDKLPQANYEQ